MVDDAFLKATYEVREAFMKSLGVVDPDSITHLINPLFQDGPLWPDLRQAWRIIRLGERTIVISDGLSDPFVGEPDPNAGFGLEVLVETVDPVSKQIETSWLFDLAYQVSQQCAAHGGVRGLIDQMGLLSLDLPVSEVLKPAANTQNRVGVLLGVLDAEVSVGRKEPAELLLPGGVVRIVTAKLLWPSELDYAAKNGKPGRQDLAERFAADGTHHLSSLSRRAVV